MKRLFVSVLILWSLVCGSARADVEPTGTYSVYCQGGSTTSSTVSGLADQCKSALETYWHSNGYGACSYVVTYDYAVQTFNLGWISSANACGNYPTLHYTASNVTCPSGTVLTNGYCVGSGSTCPDLGATQTARFPVGYVDQFGHVVGAWSPPAQGTHVAIDGCDYSVQSASDPSTCGIPAGTTSFPAVASCDYTVGSVAGEATAGESGVPTAPPSPAPTGDASTGCPAGTRNIGTESDGTPICAGDSTSSSPATSSGSTTTTTSNADGSTVRTTTSTAKNSDGSTTTTTTQETTSADGTVTTTSGAITGTNLAGEAGRSDETSDLCLLHPELNVCQNSTVTGDCEETACTGDAIQCAILRQQRKEYCEDHQDTPQSTLGKQIFSGADPLADTFPTGDKTQTVAFGSLDQTGFLGSPATCLQDKAFTVQGQAFTLPFSQVCPYLLPWRYAMLIVAALVSLRLISKGVFQ